MRLVYITGEYTYTNFKAHTVKERTQNEDFVYLEEHNPCWQTWYEQESASLKKVFAPDHVCKIEHYGSTAVSGLIAKPIIGILIGLHNVHLTNQEIAQLQLLGYCQVPTPNRLSQCSYWKKQTERKFNLAIVHYDSQYWHDHLAIRDYLRTHSDQIHNYATIKMQAIKEGFCTKESYRAYKQPFLNNLFLKAKQWQQSGNGS